MQKIIDGVHQFQREVFRKQRELFEHLAAKQQRPQALFITCSDSRINPNMLTQTEPGDLFLLRNAGNIVPPYGNGVCGEAATIEYAVAVLGIKHIIICGHSHCGAMHALLNMTDLDDLPAVSAWFQCAESTRRIAKHRFKDLAPEERLRLTTAQNVLTQLDNLRTHPSVAAGLSAGELNLHGWLYILETGSVLAYEAEKQKFAPLRSDAASVPTPARLAEAC